MTVGEVVAVNGTKITLRIFDDSSKETLFFKGSAYRGVSIREYITIQRGFRDIVCIIEGEYLDERKLEADGIRTEYSRKVDARPIGYFEGRRFKQGIKFMPMIRDPAFLMPEDRIAAIYGRSAEQGFVVGNMLKEDLPIGLPWAKLFNSHIGIFGNTGSGKSNTLAKLYTVLFERKLAAIRDVSKFVLFDFNGEYTGDQLVGRQSKSTYSLSTSTTNGTKFPLASTEFWDSETLSLLFQATTNTQRPFLNRLIEGRNRYANNRNSLTNFTKAVLKRSISAARPRPEALDLLRSVARIVDIDPLKEMLRAISWHGNHFKFYRPVDQVYFNADGAEYDFHLAPIVEQIDLSTLDAFDQLLIRSYLQLASDVTAGYVQFDHIQPLLKRIESSLVSLRKVIYIAEEPPDDDVLTVISLKRCNSEIKKVLPLLIAKHYFNQHKANVQTPPNKTLHLIIDEAHNILSHQSSRESESWKDYRLELFEEIIKEGRKFGVFITLSSQRPADISPTIVSQIHNFFIHRLVNERDLYLIDNTITTLDSLSRSLIPGLSQGSCVVTGTAFDVPMILQIDILARERQPDSDDVDLQNLWPDPVAGDL